MKSVTGLGDLGDKVTVRSGYGRNFLFPTGTAVPATDANLKAFEQRRAELEATEAEILAGAETRKEQLEGLSVTIARKAGDEGRLFGSVGSGDVAEAITASGVAVAKGEVRLPEGPIRVVGELALVLRLHADVDVTVTVEVIAED